jgi:uncharacterized phage protein gp47/JayE
MSGLTVTGFSAKTFEQVKEEIETELINKFGSINLNAESVFGQIVGIFAERESLLWQDLLAVYNSLYPDTATGSSLDGVCAIIGVYRLKAKATIVDVKIIGINQTTIPKDSEASALGIPTVFKLTNDLTIDNEACIASNIDITDLTKTEYSVIINDETITYTAVLDNTKIDIIAGLVTAINDAEIGINAVNEDDLLYINSDDDSNFSLFITNGLTIVNLTAKAQFKAVTKGKIPLPANILNIIQTPISGWISINNPNAGLTGRDLETDVELRARRELSLRIAGGGTIEAIKAKILNVSGVTSVKIIENNTDVEVNGLSPHSFESLVLNGVDLDIANAIWNSKPAGIQTIGNTSVNILDSNGTNQLIKFSRPVKLYIYGTITITKDNTNLYPINGDQSIIENIVNIINSLNVGDDVIYQSLYKAIYTVAGIQSANIEIGGTLIENTAPSLSSANINVGASQIALTDANKINIVIA